MPQVEKSACTTDTKQPDFEYSLRVYYEDTDAGGIVYYANYLKFMERARTEWLRALGFEQDQLREEQGVIFVVRSVNIQYFKPAIFNNQLKVTVSLASMKKIQLTCHQQVFNGAILNTEATVSLVCVDANSFRPKRIPEEMVLKLGLR